MWLAAHEYDMKIKRKRWKKDLYLYIILEINNEKLFEIPTLKSDFDEI